MKLSDKLIELRKTRGWSQEDFAEKLDVSRQAISRWENGTALPDAQNILQISKLFGVSADYLLNDDYESELDFSSMETTAEEATPALQKKKRRNWYLIPAICLILCLSAFAILQVMKSKDDAHTHPGDAHTHPGIIRVIENQVAPTCTTEGSYDEVLYCEECGKEILRTHIIDGMPTHQFQNEICTVCGKEQREREID